MLDMKFVGFYGIIMITPEQLAGTSEHSQQCALFCYFQINKDKYPLTKWLYSNSNGFFSTSGQKGKEKAAGLKNGVPDICLPIPSLGCAYHGLYIELKIEARRKQKNGGCSDEQLEWIAFLRQQYYKAIVCYGWESARDEIIKYLEG